MMSHARENKTPTNGFSGHFRSLFANLVQICCSPPGWDVWSHPEFLHLSLIIPPLPLYINPFVSICLPDCRVVAPGSRQAAPPRSGFPFFWLDPCLVGPRRLPANPGVCGVPDLGWGALAPIIRADVPPHLVFNLLCCQRFETLNIPVCHGSPQQRPRQTSEPPPPHDNANHLHGFKHLIKSA